MLLRWDVASRGILLIVSLVFACASWPAELPYGSDTDEHRLVAQTAVRGGHFSVGDLHGTKYPPAVSAGLIALACLGLTPAWTMLAMNSLAVTAAAWILYGLATRLYSRPAGLMAATYLLSNVIVWSSARLIIAESLFLLLAVGVLAFCLGEVEQRARSVSWGLALVSACVLTRSTGISLAVTLFLVRLLGGERSPSWADLVRCLPLLLVPLGFLVAYGIWQASFGPHPTGYAETFFLVDPWDVSKGTLSLAGLATRTVSGAVASAGDLVVTLTAPSVGGLSRLALAALLLFAACTRTNRQLFVIAAYALPYALLIAAWPYKGTRFAAPLLPVAALGAASIYQYFHQRGLRPGCAVVALLLLCHAGTSLSSIRGSVAREQEDRAAIHRSFAELASWHTENVSGDEPIASFDYREHTLRLSRSVLPMRHTSDSEDLVRELHKRDVRWLAVSHAVSHRRGVYAEAVLGELGNEARLEFQNDHFRLYRLGTRGPSNL